MNTLEECKPGVWGESECLARLEAAESARILLVSDSHGRIPILRGILKDFGPSCDALLFAGDGVEDLIECREEAIETESARQVFPPVMAMVSGNGDLPMYRVTSEKEGRERVLFRVPMAQVICACGKKILLSHGHLYSVGSSMQPLIKAARHNECQIAVYGHTHIASSQSYKSVLAVNPGSICLPRGTSKASLAIIEISASSEQAECSFYPPGEGIPPFGKKPGRRARSNA